MDENFRRSNDEGTERRLRYRQRTVFDSAFVMLEPFFDPAAGWSGLPLQHVIFRVVHENYPELTSEEVHSMAGALLRAYQNQSAGSRSSDACEPVVCPDSYFSN